MMTRWLAVAALALAACDAELVSAIGPAQLVDPDDDCAAGSAGECGHEATECGDKRSTNERKRVRTKRRPPPTLTIPKATREFVWARDQGRCRVPGCRATRNLACHHIEFRALGGDHDEQNLTLICAGHHTLLHDGLLVITGRAPDQLVFKRDGRMLVDARSAAELEVGNTLRERARGQHRTVDEAHAIARHARNQPARTSRFEDVVVREHAKQALMQLGFKARAARAAVEAACAHVGADADVASIVKAALQRTEPSHTTTSLRRTMSALAQLRP